MSVQGKLPPQFKLDVIRKKFEGIISPTTVVLLQELERFNKLIKRMDSSLNSLQKVKLSLKELSSPESEYICYNP